MPRECGRNSSLSFIVIVIVIVMLAVAFTVRAQQSGGGQQLIKPSAVPEQGDAQQPSITPLVVGSPGTNEDRSDIMTSNAITRKAAATTSSAPIFMRRAVYDSGGLFAWSLAVGDLNGDGKPDLVVLNREGTPNNGSARVLLGRGNGTFLPTVVNNSGAAYPDTIALEDLNHDGSPDLVIVQSCLNIPSLCLGVLLGNGDGTFQSPVTYAAGGWPAFSGFGHSTPLMFSDLNGDANPDLVVVNGTDRNGGHGNVGVLLGNGDGTFKPVMTYDSGAFGALSGVSADVNSDQKTDVIVFNCTTSGSTDCYANEAVVGVLLGNGDGTFQPVKTYGTGGVGGVFSLPLVVIDVSNDHKPDILVGNACLNHDCSANHGTLGVLISNGNGAFQSAQTYDLGGGGVNAIAVADLNGDGNLDGVAGSPLGVFLGKGGGTFQPFLTVQPTRGVGQVIAADLNHDKKTDLVSLYGTTNSADVSLGNGDGTFQEPQTYNFHGALFSTVILADVTVDGKPDLLSFSASRRLDYYEGSVDVLLNVFTDTTTTSLSSSLNPLIYGQKVTWTASVTTSGSIPPTGRVIFRTSGDAQNYEIGAARLDGSGVATLTRSTLNVPLGGSYPIVAVYLGDTMNSRSQSEVVLQDVRQTTSVATITSSENPSSPGQAVTFTATITSPTVTVAGPVTFTAGNTVLGTAQLSRGRATFTTSALPRGSTRVQVTYPWNSNVAKSSASLMQTVQ